jgi:hypothetical protein
MKATIASPLKGPGLFDAQFANEHWANWRRYLQSILKYPSSHLFDLGENALAVYRDNSLNACLAIIADAGSSEEHRALAVEHGAEFVVVGIPTKYKLLQRGEYGLHPSPASRLPICTRTLDRASLISKQHTLPPFRTEDDLRRAFGACHNAIYFESANDPASSFDLLSLTIAAKIMDEQSDSPEYQFGAIRDEDELRTLTRFSGLLERAREWLSGKNGFEPLLRNLPRLGPRTVSTVLRELQDFSLTLTGSSPVGTDLLGVAYEHLVGATFRGELGSYFTPRNIADFMARMLSASEGKIFDPSCGSAGLLIAAFRYASSLGRSIELYGNDLNPRMVEAAKINVLLHGVSTERITYGDGLDLSRMLTTWFRRAFQQSVLPLWDCAPGEFDFVLANPPFAGHEKNAEVLSRFATSRRNDGSVRSLNKTLPFLELIVASLRFGGKAGIVVPTSILNAEEESFVRFRELLLNHVELLAIIGLPEKAFVHTDCGVHGALLFFERRRNPRSEYKVFVGRAVSLGYDRLGKPTRESDLPMLLERYKSGEWDKHHFVSIRDLRKHERWDVNWIELSRSMDVEADTIALTEIVEVRNARWSRRELVNDSEYRYFEVADADIHTGVVREVHLTSGFELSKKGRIRNRVRTGDLLLPNHRDSLMAAGSENGRSVVLADESLDGVLTTDRFMVLRPKVEPRLAAAILNSKGVRRQLIAQCRGAASLDIREHTLAKVQVPRRLLLKPYSQKVQKLASEMESLRAELTERTAELNRTIEDLFGASGQPLRPASAR